MKKRVAVKDLQVLTVADISKEMVYKQLKTAMVQEKTKLAIQNELSRMAIREHNEINRQVQERIQKETEERIEQLSRALREYEESFLFNEQQLSIVAKNENTQEHKQLLKALAMPCEGGVYIEGQHKEVYRRVFETVLERRRRVMYEIDKEDNIYDKTKELADKIKLVRRNKYTITEETGRVINIDIREGTVEYEGEDGIAAGHIKKSKSTSYRYMAVDDYVISHHTLIVLAKYGYEIVALTRESHSLLVTDHVNEDTMDNRIANLRILSRSDNSRLARNKEYSAYNYLDLIA